MLDSGAICISQSTWCNAVVLVQKKNGGINFCREFLCLNAHTKKDCYLLPRIQEALKSLVSAGYFSCQNLEVWILANSDGQILQAIHHIHHRQSHALWAVQCPCHFSMADAELTRGVEPDILAYLSG